jgi:hypothetical protein
VLGRQVALKVPRPEVLVTPDFKWRFLREAEAASRLDHPHIVPVYEVGEEGPVCYIASAYCEGLTLAQWLRLQSASVPVRVACRLVAVLASAVAHARERGILPPRSQTRQHLAPATGWPPSPSYGFVRDGVRNGNPPHGMPSHEMLPIARIRSVLAGQDKHPAAPEPSASGARALKDPPIAVTAVISLRALDLAGDG